MRGLKPVRSCVLALALGGLVSTAGSDAIAEVYLLQPDGTGDFPSIQTAMASATDGDVIELADGTYVGHANRNIDFLGKAVILRSQSGNAEACVIHCQGGAALQSRGFHFHSGEGPASVVQAITVTHGNADYGAGILCESSAPTILDCVFLDNDSG
jgi:hypothetical protein